MRRAYDRKAKVASINNDLACANGGSEDRGNAAAAVARGVEFEASFSQEVRNALLGCIGSRSASVVGNDCASVAASV